MWGQRLLALVALLKTEDGRGGEEQGELRGRRSGKPALQVPRGGKRGAPLLGNSAHARVKGDQLPAACREAPMPVNTVRARLARGEGLARLDEP